MNRQCTQIWQQRLNCLSSLYASRVASCMLHDRSSIVFRAQSQTLRLCKLLKVVNSIVDFHLFVLCCKFPSHCRLPLAPISQLVSFIACCLRSFGQINASDILQHPSSCQFPHSLLLLFVLNVCAPVCAPVCVCCVWVCAISFYISLELWLRLWCAYVRP